MTTPKDVEEEKPDTLTCTPLSTESKPGKITPTSMEMTHPPLLLPVNTTKRTPSSTTKESASSDPTMSKELKKN